MYRHQKRATLDQALGLTAPAVRNAFSLVELSIVLVILGLLVGGVLSGQSLIHAAELRSVSTDFNKYMTAERSFRDKYFAIPGDITNATTFWGSLGGDGANATCQALSGAGTTATCNGDGDGSLLNGALAGSESFRFWQHLANAGLIEGNYTGIAGAGYATGINVVASKIQNSYFLAQNGFGHITSTSGTVFAGTTSTFPGDYGLNMFAYYAVGAAKTITNSWPLKPEDAWNIDTKLDDGNPMQGTVIALKGNGTNTNCTTNAGVAPPGDSGSIYLLTNANKDCALYFTRAF